LILLLSQRRSGLSAACDKVLLAVLHCWAFLVRLASLGPVCSTGPSLF
jgi:hypothetical protein